MSRDDSDAESLGEVSADETEVDETMARFANRYLRRMELSAQQQRGAQEEQGAQKSRAPVSGLATANLDASPHMSASKRVFQPTQVKSMPNTSFDQSLDRLHLDEDDKAVTLVTPDDHEQERQQGMAHLGQSMQYHSTQGHYNSNSFQPMDSSGPFSTPAPSAFAHYPAGYIDPSQFSMYNNSPYTLPMSQASMDPSMTAHDLVHSYSSEELFTPTTFMPDMSTNASTSFNGLPYSFDMDNAAPPHQYLVPQMGGHNEQQ